jgi:hypothetical protein
VTAALVLICGTVQQLAYVVALPFQVAADVPGPGRSIRGSR